MIRDGGSLAATFVDQLHAQWILLLKIELAHRERGMERPGFMAPVLIDADPAKRPMSTDGRIYSALSGPAHSISWAEAQLLVVQIAEHATSLNVWAASSLRQLQFAVDHRGQLPPDIAL